MKTWSRTGLGRGSTKTDVRACCWSSACGAGLLLLVCCSCCWSAAGGLLLLVCCCLLLVCCCWFPAAAAAAAAMLPLPALRGLLICCLSLSYTPLRLYSSVPLQTGCWKHALNFDKFGRPAAWQCNSSRTKDRCSKRLAERWPTEVQLRVCSTFLASV